MKTDTHDIRRILVTLDSSDTGRSALDIAARLAALLHAELEGVFIEDMNLISLADLPFLREIKSSSLTEEAISPERMQRDLKAQARQAEHMLQQHAANIGVSYTFRIWRGHGTLETLSTSFEADILSITRTPAYRRAAAAKRPGRIEKICVLYSGTPPSPKTLHTARHLAETLDAPITVLLPADSASKPQLDQNAAAILTMAQQPVHLEYFDSLPALLDQLNCNANAVLILQADHPLFREPAFNQQLDTLAIPVLIVR